MDERQTDHAIDPDTQSDAVDEHAPDRWESGLPIVRSPADDGEYSAPDGAPLGARTWRQELPRWLATLDSARTRREYEKAVRYFFQAPGVPEALQDLTFDLLLAYRGSLALRTGGRQTQATAPSSDSPSLRQVSAGRSVAAELPAGSLAEEAPRERRSSAPEDGADSTQTAGRATALAPATVNVRLTALRQFLAHCSLWDLLPQLAPERIRAALRRLSIERRRPYQILAEPEWTAFLAAARAPHRRSGKPSRGLEPMPADVPSNSKPPGSLEAPDIGDDGVSAPASVTAPITGAHDRRMVGPWGVTRARRTRPPVDATSDGGEASPDQPSAATRPAPTEVPLDKSASSATAAVRSRAGLTGVRTAQRDHALLALALATGLRAIELCGLNVGDVSREWHAGREEWWLVLPDAKTKGQRGGRTLPLAPALVETLLEYVRATDRRWEDDADRATPLFVSRRRAAGAPAHEQPPANRLSPEQVRRIVDRVEAQWRASGAGVADGRAISPHALRHSTAVALLEGNQQRGRAPASVEHVRGWLGHFDIRTTQGYLAHLDARRHRRPFALQPVEEQPAAATGDVTGGPTTAGDETARRTE